MSLAVLDQLDTFGPDRCRQLDYEQASEYTRRLARTHYENFTVVSWLLPRRLRDDFRHVYAFCRWSDDLGDETGDARRSLDLLNWWRGELDACYEGRPRHPVFVALLATIRKHDIPRRPFDDLIDAFVQDQHVTRYETWPQLLDYCTRSANPVGRLVLQLCGCGNDTRRRLSDSTCTALQLANFWQDVRRDVIQRDRVYVPALVAARHGLDVKLMVQAIRLDERRRADSCCRDVRSPGVGALLPAYRATLRELVDRTWPLFKKGRQLLPLVPRDVQVDVKLFTLGGESILHKIQRQRYNTLQHRPALGKGAKVALLFRALAGKFFAGVSTSWSRP